jgi:hypothetical protein
METLPCRSFPYRIDVGDRLWKHFELMTFASFTKDFVNPGHYFLSTFTLRSFFVGKLQKNQLFCFF